MIKWNWRVWIWSIQKVGKVLVLFIGPLWIAITVANPATYDPVVGTLERHYGGPGSVHVLPDCGCTVRYMGTSVHGRRYTVTLDRLD